MIGMQLGGGAAGGGGQGMGTGGQLPPCPAHAPQTNGHLLSSVSSVSLQPLERLVAHNTKLLLLFSVHRRPAYSIRMIHHEICSKQLLHYYHLQALGIRKSHRTRVGCTVHST